MYHGATPADDFTCEKCQKCFAGKGLLAKHNKHSMCDIIKKLSMFTLQKEVQTKAIFRQAHVTSFP